MPKKPPVPPDISSNPRFLGSKGTGSSSVLAALSALSRQPLQAESYQAFRDEITQEKNDRGAAILVVTNLENMLQVILECRIRIHDKRHYEHLFGFESPLGTFENKIRMAYALEIFGPEMHRNLIYAKHVRNAFAHARNPINFETAEVKAVCDLLKRPDPYDEEIQSVSDWRLTPTTTRMKFIVTCNMMMGNLGAYGHYASGSNRPLIHPMDNVRQLIERPPPLP